LFKLKLTETNCFSDLEAITCRFPSPFLFLSLSLASRSVSLLLHQFAIRFGDVYHFIVMLLLLLLMFLVNAICNLCIAIQLNNATQLPTEHITRHT